MTFWQIWLKQQMRQPSLWGLEKSAGILSGRCAWQVRPSSADWATSQPSCLMRIIAAHAYHRIDYEEVWVTLRDDVPRLGRAINRWRQAQDRSEEHTSELQSLTNLVCRLLLQKKKTVV